MAATFPRTNVVVITPFYADIQILSSAWGTNTASGGGSVYWSTSNWLQGSPTENMTPSHSDIFPHFVGANNSPNPSHYLSSFDTLDQLWSTLTNSVLFPRMQMVVFGGFSAGAQMLGRHSWASPIPYTATATAIQSSAPHTQESSSSSIILRYIISDASSYLYLSPVRPAASCRLLSDTGSEFACPSFPVPSAEETALCSSYDSWKYGINSFPSSGYAYLAPYVNDAQVHQYICI